MIWIILLPFTLLGIYFVAITLLGWILKWDELAFKNREE